MVACFLKSVLFALDNAEVHIRRCVEVSHHSPVY